MSLGSAAICRRGHVLSIYSESPMFGTVPDRCHICGALVTKSCEKCGAPIAGAEIPDLGPLARVHLDVDAMQDMFNRPNFCTQADCGAALPWADRQTRIWELENRLADELVDEHDRLQLREQLEALTAEDLDDAEAERRWKKVASLGGRAFNRVMTDVGLPLINAKLKHELGL